MQQVVASADEAKLSALFLNAQAACPLCIALVELGHPQAAMPLQTDNSTACGIINNTVKQNDPKLSTCGFIGSQIDPNRDDFTFFGIQAAPIGPITSPSIILPNTIKPCSP